MDPLTNPAYLIFAALLPLLIALFKQAHFANNVNALIALTVYAVVGVGASLAVNGVPDVGSATQFVVTATVVGKAAYDLLWSQIPVAGTSLDDALTQKTTFLAHTS